MVSRANHAFVFSRTQSFRRVKVNSVIFCNSHLAGFALLVTLGTLPAVGDLIVDDSLSLSHLTPQTNTQDEESAVCVCVRARLRAGQHAHLQAAGVDDLVADGALHQREAELLLLRVHRVLLPRLATRKTHRCVRQHRLGRRTGRHKQVSQVAAGAGGRSGHRLVNR